MRNLIVLLFLLFNDSKFRVEPVHIEKWNGEAQIDFTYLNEVSSIIQTTYTEEVNFNVTLYERPKSNQIRFAIKKSEDFEFLEQKELRLENLGHRFKECTINYCYDWEGNQVIYRPINVIDSIAIYSSTKKNHIEGQTNYETGKVGHLYRSQIKDAKGNKAWGAFKYINGILINEIPDWFLNSASYPIVDAATFGYAASGGTDDNPSNNFIYCLSVLSASPASPAAPASNGALTSITTFGRIKAGSPQNVPALYSNVAGAPSSRLAYVTVATGGTVYGGSNAANTTNIAYATIVSGTQYWLATQVNAGGSDPDAFVRWDSTGVNELAYQGYTSLAATDYPSTTTIGGVAMEKWSIYATYTPAAAPSCGGTSFTTTFTLTENPMVQTAGCWLQGLRDGIDWKDVRTNGSIAYGQQAGGATYDDSTATLNGTWSATQEANATIYANDAGTDANQEVELRLRTTITANSITGYEINWNTRAASPYYEVVRWNGAYGMFTACSHIVAASAPVTGDIIKATISGNTLKQYLNGVLLTTVDVSTDCMGGTVYSTGNPGIGLFLHNLTGVGDNSKFGISRFQACSPDCTSVVNTAIPPSSIPLLLH